MILDTWHLLSFTSIIYFSASRGNIYDHMFINRYLNLVLAYRRLKFSIFEIGYFWDIWFHGFVRFVLLPPLKRAYVILERTVVKTLKRLLRLTELRRSFFIAIPEIFREAGQRRTKSSNMMEGSRIRANKQIKEYF